MAAEGTAETTLPLPPRVSASSAPTVGALLTRASAAVTKNSGERPSLLSRILHRGRSGGFSCRLRLPLPRYCSSGAAAKEEEVVAPKVIASRAEPRESPPSSMMAEKKALPASLGLGASLLLLLSKSAAELSRMAELRAQMERLMTDVRAGVRSCGDGHTDSVVKEPIVCAGDLSQSLGGAMAGLGGSESAGHREAMGQMEAELEAELSRLQLDSNDEKNAEANKSGATSGSHSVICSDSDMEDAETDQDDEEEEVEENSPAHGGVSARELERRLHELLQSRHEARIAELESALERARRKLEEKEREACRWRDTAKVAARFTDDSRLR